MTTLIDLPAPDTLQDLPSRPRTVLPHGWVLIPALMLAGAPSFAAAPKAAALSGNWRGEYVFPLYSDKGKDAKQPSVAFTVQIAQTGTKVTGKISETVAEKNGAKKTLGADIIDGVLTKAGVLSFVKKYDGSGGWSHGVDYWGAVLKSGTRVEGRWRVGDLTGTFSMTRTLPAGTAALSPTAAERVWEKWDTADKKFGSIASGTDVQPHVALLAEAVSIARISGDDKLLAEALERLAKGYYAKLTQLKKTVAIEEEVLAVYRRLGAGKDVVRMLGTLAKHYDHIQDHRKVIIFQTEYLKLAENTLPKAERASAYSVLGKAYLKSGRPKESLPYFEDELKLAIELQDKNAWKINEYLGKAYLELGDLRNAVSAFQQSGLNENLGDVFADLGDYRQAIFYYEKGGVSDAKKALKLGRVYRQLGDYKKSISLLEEPLRNKNLPVSSSANFPGVKPSFLRALGLVYAELGDYPKAITYYKEAAKQSKLSWDATGTAASYGDLGLMHYNTGDYKKALAYDQRAIKAQKILKGSTRDIELNIADVHLAQGDIKLAEKEFLRLKDPLRLGRLYLAKGLPARAAESFGEALKFGQKSHHAGILFASNVGLGHAYSQLKKHPQASSHYRKALDLVETQREALSPAEKAAFFSAKVDGFDRTEPYEGLIRSLVTQGQTGEAFYWSENLKARLLTEAIARGKAGAGFALPQDLAAREEAFDTKIRGLRAEMERLFRSGENETFRRREAELTTERAEMDRFVSGLRQSHPEYAAIKHPTPIKAESVSLKPEEALLAFEVTADRSFLFVLTGSDHKVSAREIPLTRAQLEKAVLQYRDYFEGISSAADLANFKISVGKTLYDALFGDALQGLPKTASIIIVPDETLGLVPFESLPTALPKVEKMADGKHGPFPMGVTYLGDDFRAGYAQSATSLSLLRSLAKVSTSGQGALAVVDPVFSKADSRYSGIARTSSSDESLRLMGAISNWEKMGVAGTRRRKSEKSSKDDDADKEDQTDAEPPSLFPRLEKTHEIGAAFKGLYGRNSTVLEGLEAREDAVAALPFPSYKYVVFGTHGILDGDLPYIREPALVLSQIGNPDGKDGFLTMSEVMGLKIPADVVALTACRTGVGRKLSGEGLLGMGRAFQHAGAANVLMSLWSVEETATVTLTNSFFNQLNLGKSAKEALKLARDDMRSQGYEHPFYWSAFVLVSR